MNGRHITDFDATHIICRLHSIGYAIQCTYINDGRVIFHFPKTQPLKLRNWGCFLRKIAKIGLCEQWHSCDWTMDTFPGEWLVDYFYLIVKDEGAGSIPAPTIDFNN